MTSAAGRSKGGSTICGESESRGIGMGFRIEFDHDADTEKFLDKLRTSPAEIFSAPYLGYMLFLWTGHEDRLIKAFSRQLVKLDALTGDIVAFVLFSARFGSRISTGWSSKERREPTAIHSINLSDLKRFGITRLVKGGACGWVNDGDQIVATTFAVDNIARTLKISSELPCLLLFDPFFEGTFKVVPLTKTLIDEIIPLTRTVLDRLQQDPRNEELYRSIKRLKSLEDATPGLELRLDIKPPAIKEQINEHTAAAHYSTKLSELRCFIIEGKSSAKLRDVAKSFLKIGNTSLPEEGLLGNYYDSISSTTEYRVLLTKTVASLIYYESQQCWPLQEEWRDRFKKGTGRYIHKLLPDIEDSWLPNDFASLKLIEGRIIDLRERYISQIIQTLPSQNTIVSVWQRFTAEQNRLEASRLESLRTQLSSIDNEVGEVCKKLASLRGISFSDIFSKEAKILGITTSTRSLSSDIFNVMKPFLRPQTLIRLLRALHGA